MIEHAFHSRTRTGEQTSGDRHLMVSTRSGMLIAVIDGVGHGPEAGETAEAAARVISEFADDSLISIARSCDQELRATRGVVMALAAFTEADGTFTWLGVGNVQGVIWRCGEDGAMSREYLLQRAGVVGYRLPPLSAAVLTVSPGDTLVLATDGVAPSFERAVRLEDSPEVNAERIIRDHATGDDDALALVARYGGARRDS